MRWFHLTVTILFAAAIIIFAAQNLQIVTTTFLGLSARAPLALLVVVVYLLGTATGSSLLALVRRSVEGGKTATGDTGLIVAQGLPRRVSSMSLRLSR